MELTCDQICPNPHSSEILGQLKYLIQNGKADIGPHGNEIGTQWPSLIISCVH